MPTGVHGGNEHKVGGKGQAARSRPGPFDPQSSRGDHDPHTRAAATLREPLRFPRYARAAVQCIASSEWSADMIPVIASRPKHLASVRESLLHT